MSEETFRWVITGGVGVSALCILVMAGAVLALYKVITKVHLRVEDLSGRVTPIIDTVQKLMAENAPRITNIANSAQVIAANAKEVSVEVRDQAHRFADVGRDIADRTRAQVARADAAVDDTVANLQVVGSQAKEAVLKPVREVSAITAGIKAAVSSYAAGRRQPIDHIAQDEEMFI